jgi:LysR family transcriptional regulator, pca operon transcriptional activator
MDQADLISRVRLRHLHAFVTVCEEGHVGRAAARLRLSQPAVSKTLAELEDIVGTRLVNRGRRGAQPTRQGEEFLPHAMAVLASLGRAAAAMSGERSPAFEAVHVGALPTVAPSLLPAALEELRRRRPDSRVVLQTAANAALLYQLTTGVLDVVVGRMSDPSLMKDLTFEWLHSEPLVLAVRPGHPLAGVALAGVESVLAFPLVVATAGTTPRHNAESFLRARGAALPSARLETLSVSVARLVVQRSDAVWFVPAGAIRDDQARGVLGVLDVPTAGTEEPVGLLRRRDGELNAATQELMQLLRDAAARPA